MSALAEIYHPASSRRVLWVRAINWVTALALLGAMWLMIRMAWGAYNLQYTLTESTLQITFGPTAVEIPREDIIRAETMNVTRGRRHMGTALSGLQEGRWSFNETGVIRLYSTTTQPLTVIETSGGKWGISPDDPEGFLRALESGATGRWGPVPTGAGTAAVVFTVIIGILVLVTLGIMLAVERGASTMKYVLDADALLIHVGWLKTRVPYARIRSVEVASPRGRPMRIYGASIPGFYWGHFSWKGAGRSLWLYCTRLDRVVLVQVPGKTIGLSPAETEAFAAALSRRAGLA